MKKTVIGLVAAASFGALVAGPSIAANNNDKHAANSGKGGSDKVTICHVPPGNPSNAHYITVSRSAVAAHIAHGDFEAACYKSPPPPPELPPLPTGPS